MNISSSDDSVSSADRTLKSMAKFLVMFVFFAVVSGMISKPPSAGRIFLTVALGEREVVEEKIELRLRIMSDDDMLEFI